MAKPAHIFRTGYPGVDFRTHGFSADALIPAAAGWEWDGILRCWRTDDLQVAMKLMGYANRFTREDLERELFQWTQEQDEILAAPLADRLRAFRAAALWWRPVYTRAELQWPEPEPVGIGHPLTVAERSMEEEGKARARRWNAMTDEEKEAQIRAYQNMYVEYTGQTQYQADLEASWASAERESTHHRNDF